jgi:hypothetical protein
MYTVRFGHIPLRLDLLWSRGQVRTIEPFEERRDWVVRRAHPDGHYYPPQQHTLRGWPPEVSERVPQSDRPALLHSVPATHELMLREFEPDDEALREGLAAFVIHFLGYLLGHRTQFADWWIDGRLPSKSQAEGSTLSQRQIAIALDVAATSWQGVAPGVQRVITNAFFMHNRSPAYEWPWERFMIEYQVFDALYSVARDAHGVRANGHADRFHALASRFGFFMDVERVSRIVELRNALFHQALWVDRLPTSGGGEDGFYAPVWLRGINQRLGLSVLGFTGPYIGSSWISLVRSFVDLDRLSRHRSS